MSSESSKNWIIVAEFSGSVYAEMAENILNDNDIPCYTKGDFLSTAYNICLLYTSPSPRDATLSRMPSSA